MCLCFCVYGLPQTASLSPLLEFWQRGQNRAEERDKDRLQPGVSDKDHSPLYPGLCSQEHIRERQCSRSGEAWGGEHRLQNPWCLGLFVYGATTLPIIIFGEKLCRLLATVSKACFFLVLTYNWLLLQNWIPAQGQPDCRLTEP